jgi:copper(I)-binding protein
MKGYNMKHLKEIVFATALSLGALFSVNEGHAEDMKLGDLVIRHTWSAEAPATAPVAAGFLEITNNGKADDTLLKVTAEISDTVQLHEMSMQGDVMKMTQLKDGIPIPVGKTVVLKPMSLHIMFLKLKSHPKLGDHFKGTLTFKNAGTIDVDFAVEPKSM